VCTDGACSCRFTVCDTECVNTAADHDHCGGCDKSCQPLETCCAASCTDLEDDPGNCGTCGHNCDGGACVAGLCQPVLLATDPAASHPRAIALSGSYVYFAHENGIDRVPKDGGVAADGGLLLEALWSGSSIPRAMAIDSTTIYWTSETPGTLFAMPLAGGLPTSLATGDSLLGLALDVPTVYFVDWGIGQIDSVATAGGAKSILGTDAPGNVYMCAVSGDELFYTTYGTVAKISTFGGFPDELAIGQSNAYAIAVDQTSAYWSDDDGVYRIPKDGGVAMQLSAELGVRAIAVDGMNLYWTNQSGAIRRVPVAGGVVETLVEGQDSPEALAVDATSVYWTNLNDATIWKVAK